LRRLLRNGLFLLRSSSTELRPIVFGFRLLESRRSFMGGASIGFPFLVLAKPIAFWIVLARPCGLPLPFVHVGHVSKSFFTCLCCITSIGLCLTRLTLALIYPLWNGSF